MRKGLLSSNHWRVIMKTLTSKKKNEEKTFSTPHRPPPPSHWAFLVKTLQQLLIKKGFSSSDFVITSRTNRAKYDCGARWWWTHRRLIKFAVNWNCDNVESDVVESTGCWPPCSCAVWNQNGLSNGGRCRLLPENIHRQQPDQPKPWLHHHHDALHHLSTSQTAVPVAGAWLHLHLVFCRTTEGSMVAGGQMEAAPWKEGRKVTIPYQLASSCQTKPCQTIPCQIAPQCHTITLYHTMRFSHPMVYQTKPNQTKPCFCLAGKKDENFSI